MWPFSKQRFSDPVDESALVEVVRPFNYRARHALYAATNTGALRRKTWNGCAFNRAGETLGATVSNQYMAAEVFDLSPGLIANFLRVWDQLKGSDQRCTELLRSAILKVGLFAHSSGDVKPDESLESISS